MAKRKSPVLSAERVAAVEESVASLVEPILPTGVTLAAVSLEKEAGRWRLQVAIERPPHGVSIDDCQQVSERLDPLLDESPALADFARLDLSYDLEISSPGVDRALKSERELRFYRGHPVTLRARRARRDPPPPLTQGVLGDYDAPSRTLWIHPQGAAADAEPVAVSFSPQTLEIRLNTPVILPDPL